MERIYRYRMTTTSGGNLSIRDENGDIWITPAGFDKGSPGREDIIGVKAVGCVAGLHRPWPGSSRTRSVKPGELR